MRIPVSLRIAWRWLFGRKSHSAIGAIAAVAVAGVAVATAAMICVMAVFNGFHDLLQERLDRMSPDVAVLPLSGKTIADADSLAEALAALPGVALATPTLTEQALLLHDGRESPVTLKGVRVADYRRMTSLDSILLDGSVPLEAPAPVDAETGEGGDAAPASLSVGAAMRVGVGSVGARLTVFAPKRVGRVNLSNPLSSFMVDSLLCTSVFESQQSDLDDNTVVTDLERVRSLLMYDTEGSAVEVMAAPGTDPTSLAEAIRDATGGRWDVRDRARQRMAEFRMVNVEKWMSFLLLSFILVIASFNIISTVSMMVVDRQEVMRTLLALGMSRRRVGGVFAWESLLVTLCGGAAGMALGSLLCLAQQTWGLVRLNGDPSSLVVSAYPVHLMWGDLLATLLPLAAVGVICAMIGAGFARSRARGLLF